MNSILLAKAKAKSAAGGGAVVSVMYAQMRMSLDGALADAETDSAFRRDFARSLVDATKLPGGARCVEITQLSAGSILVDFKLKPEPGKTVGAKVQLLKVGVVLNAKCT